MVLLADFTELLQYTLEVNNNLIKIIAILLREYALDPIDESVAALNEF